MILVAFLVPLAAYLFVLSAINRRHRPVIIPGTWDLVGLLLGASGFLFAGGPAVLSSLSEQWRMFWLFGHGNPLGGVFAAPALWLALPAAYFLAVSAGVVYLFSQRRSLTCVYNVEPATVEELLAEACDALGLGPIRSGNVYVFGLPAEAGPPAAASGGSSQPEGIQPPHARGLMLPKGPAAIGRAGSAGGGAGGGSEPIVSVLEGESAVLEVESFAALKNVTLRWTPHDSGVRKAVEAELGRRLGQTESPAHETAAWLSLASWAMLVACLVVMIGLTLRGILGR